MFHSERSCFNDRFKWYFVLNIKYYYNKTIFGTWEWGIVVLEFDQFFIFLLSSQLFGWPSLMTPQIFCLICLFFSIQSDSLDCGKNVYNISQTECHWWNFSLKLYLKFNSFESQASSRTNMRIADWNRTSFITYNLFFQWNKIIEMLETKILNLICNLCFAFTFYISHNLCCN